MSIVPEPSPASLPAPSPRARRHRLHPKKLLLGKWTAAFPVDREKHFLVVRVVEPDPPTAPVEWVELEAIRSGRVVRLRWRDLGCAGCWQQGWR